MSFEKRPGESLRGPWAFRAGQCKANTDKSEDPPHGQQTSFILGLGAALNFWKMTELWMPGAFGQFQDGVKIHHAFIELAQPSQLEG